MSFFRLSYVLFCFRISTTNTYRSVGEKKSCISQSPAMQKGRKNVNKWLLGSLCAMITQWRIIRHSKSFDLCGFYEIVKRPLKTAKHKSLTICPCFQNSFRFPMSHKSLFLWKVMREVSRQKRALCLNPKVHFLTTSVQ